MFWLTWKTSDLLSLLCSLRKRVATGETRFKELLRDVEIELRDRGICEVKTVT
jgi:hypothetical protein